MSDKIKHALAMLPSELETKAEAIAQYESMVLKFFGDKEPKRFLLLHSWFCAYANTLEDIVTLISQRHYFYEARVYDLESEDWMTGRYIESVTVKLKDPA